MKFVIDNVNDVIQRHLANGEFFEIEELKIMKEFCKEGATIIDIGANVGNHSVYFSKFFNARLIFPIEPIPKAYKLLLANLCLNYCHNVNVDHVGIALGRSLSWGYPLMAYGEDNLGSTRLYSSEILTEGVKFDKVRVVPGDWLFENEAIDFIKIDVEGMEIEVLAGLEETIKKSRPNMFIEVLNENREDFDTWLSLNNYSAKITTSYNDIFSNFIATPNGI